MGKYINLSEGVTLCSRAVNSLFLSFAPFLMKQLFRYHQPFQCENGALLPELEIAFHTYGKMNAERNNVVWIFHALTASSDVADWWNGMVGEGKLFTPEKYFIVCANILGSCYGTSGPTSVNPESGGLYGNSFPEITIRDMVKVHQLLQSHLGIKRIKFGIGGSMGGYQLLEWSVSDPDLFENSILLVTSAKESPWGIAVHTTQRMAIETDPSWQKDPVNGGKKGLETARGIGMLTYRNFEIYKKTQSDPENHTGLSRAETYIRYQGKKLADRFSAHSYWLLTKAMDSHDLDRKREKTDLVLSKIKSKSLIIGISSDILCPVSEQAELQKKLPDATLSIIDSSFGHDGFLIEFEKITNQIFTHFWKEIS